MAREKREAEEKLHIEAVQRAVEKERLAIKEEQELDAKHIKEMLAEKKKRAIEQKKEALEKVGGPCVTRVIDFVL